MRVNDQLKANTCIAGHWRVPAAVHSGATHPFTQIYPATEVVFVCRREGGSIEVKKCEARRWHVVNAL